MLGFTALQMGLAAGASALALAIAVTLCWCYASRRGAGGPTGTSALFRDVHIDVPAGIERRLHPLATPRARGVYIDGQARAH